MKTYALYGHLSDSDIHVVCGIIERALSVKFVAHESSYRGEYYRAGITGEENFVLQKNYDEYEKEWTEPEHQKYPFLLYINATPRLAELKKTLESVEGLSLIKHEEIPTSN